MADIIHHDDVRHARDLSMSFTTYGVDLESALSATRLNLPLDLHYPPLAAMPYVLKRSDLSPLIARRAEQGSACATPIDKIKQKW